MAGERPKTSAAQPVHEPSVAVNPTDSTEQHVAGTTIQCISDLSDDSSAAQPAETSAEQAVRKRKAQHLNSPEQPERKAQKL